jgi:hypothetical protein
LRAVAVVSKRRGGANALAVRRLLQLDDIGAVVGADGGHRGRVNRFAAPDSEH